jgi:periplasmic divalent cation tolerance protein
VGGVVFITASLYLTTESAVISILKNRVAMKSIIIVSTTLESREEAEKLARLVVDDRLVACAQISGPITSCYRWQGKVESATEFTLSMKTTIQRLPDLEARLIEHHPYDVPEIISRGLDGVNSEYLDWVYGEVQK